MAVRDGPNDVLRSKSGVAAEKHLWIARRHRLGINLRHVPFVELDAAIALDPWKRTLLADRDQHIIAREMFIGFAGGDEFAAPLGIAYRFHLLKNHPRELAALVGDFLWHEVIEGRDVLVHGVFLFPGRRFHFLETGADDHFDVFAAEPARRPAAIHCGVAASEDNDALADLADVTAGDA